VEQLYPLPAEQIKEVLRGFSSLQEIRWVQEEPANQGAWPFMALNLPEHLDGRTLYRVSRNASSAPAVGSHTVHELEQQQLVEQAFSG
jgi:2-oxoglutarate decarboxylase